MLFPVVCFGEILWDILPGGEKAGGAPMNVAYHLTKLHTPAALISRIGADDHGLRLKNILQAQGVSTEFIQTDTKHRTGVVYAQPNENHEVSYEIVQPVAWDFIEWEDRFTELLQQAEYFVYGSLGARSETSKKTVQQLLEKANKRVCDINIRPPHFTREGVLQLLHQVDILKLNENELPLLAGWFGTANNITEQVNRIQDNLHIPTIIVTRGEHGALINLDGAVYEHPGYRVAVADTVGSGDSFLAALLAQFLKGASPEEALDFACATGALIASYSGACPDYDPNEIRELQKTQKI